MGLKLGGTYHSNPFPISKVLFCRPSNALWLVKTEKTVVELAHNILSTEEVIEQPPLPELPNVCAEYGRGVGPEGSRLIDRNQQVFKLKRPQFKVSRK